MTKENFVRMLQECTNLTDSEIKRHMDICWVPYTDDAVGRSQFITTGIEEGMSEDEMEVLWNRLDRAELDGIRYRYELGC